MRQPVPSSGGSGNTGFQKIVDGFLLQPGLPFASALNVEKTARIFRRYGGLFVENGIYMHRRGVVSISRTGAARSQGSLLPVGRHQQHLLLAAGQA